MRSAFAVGSSGREQIAIPIAAVPSKASDGPFKHQVHNLKRATAERSRTARIAISRRRPAGALDRHRAPMAPPAAKNAPAGRAVSAYPYRTHEGFGGVRLSKKPLKMLAPRAGFEPATNRLTAGCSTAELPGNA